MIDRTGLTGLFNIQLQYTADQDATLGANQDEPPSLATAIEEQLGLKLAPATGPIPVLIIDHVERPSEN